LVQLSHTVTRLNFFGHCSTKGEHGRHYSLLKVQPRYQTGRHFSTNGSKYVAYSVYVTYSTPDLAFIHRIHMNHPNQRNACTLNQTFSLRSNPYSLPISSATVILLLLEIMYKPLFGLKFPIQTKFVRPNEISNEHHPRQNTHHNPHIPQTINVRSHYNFSH
jgi:hypothetical protein